MTDPLRFPVLLEALSNGKWRATAITVSMASLAATRQDALDGVAEAIRRKMKRLRGLWLSEFANDTFLVGAEESLASIYVPDKPRFFHQWVDAMSAQGAGTTFEPYEASIVVVAIPEPKPAAPA
jgi:hypothetical protein